MLIYERSYSSDKCCKSLVIQASPKDGQLSYNVTGDKGCPVKINEAGRVKLISANNDPDGSLCILSWFCRTTRQAVHVFCSKNKVSKSQKKWIDGQFDKLKLLKQKVDIEQKLNFANGKCFNKKA